MKKNIFSSLLVGAVVLGGSVSVLADPIDGQDNDYNTKANVKLVASDAPTNREKPNSPEGGTNQSGPLSLDNIIHFDFGETTVSGVDSTKGLVAEVMQNIQVTDNRGTGEGWKLQMSQSKLKDGDKELKGAFIHMGNGTVVAGMGNKGEAPTLTKDIVLTEAPQTVFKAQKDPKTGIGMGTWLAEFNDQEKSGEITLDIPGNSYVGSYEGTVNWSLTDGPEA